MNRRERRKADAQARKRRRVISKMVPADRQAELFALAPSAARLVLLRLAYAGWHRGQLTAAEARLFGARVTRGRDGK